MKTMRVLRQDSRFQGDMMMCVVINMIGVIDKIVRLRRGFRCKNIAAIIL